MGVGKKERERERYQLVRVGVTLGVPFLVGGTVLFPGCVEVGSHGVLTYSSCCFCADFLRSE